jgi:Tfp pilus assembly protein PilF
MSTKGALLCILGEVDKAMGVLNEVLRSDPNHYLALMRRSQAYKKVPVLNI